MKKTLLKETTESVKKYFKDLGIPVTDKKVLSILIILYLDGVKHGLQEAREIYNDKGGEV